MVMLLLGSLGAAAQVTTTTVTDTIYHADGSKAGGLVILSWSAFTTGAGQPVAGGSRSVTIGNDGTLLLQLAPNQGATPAGTFYTAVYHLDDGAVSREYWTVPVSTTAVTLSAIRTQALPATVAVQTASKSYVDDAVAAALAGHPAGGAVTFLNRTGDAMMGPLGLAGDPSTGSQAANKHYVDAAVSSVSTGLVQKVGTAPTGAQIIIQPSGTQMQVNALNGVSYASQYVNGRGNNGVGNALNSPLCTGGCQLVIEQEYNSPEVVPIMQGKSSPLNGTHVEDRRGGGRQDSFLNPVNQNIPGYDVGENLNVTSTRSASSVFEATHSRQPTSVGLQVTHQGLTGGQNQLPATIPGNNGTYFKSNYNAVSVDGVYNTMGQHVLGSNTIQCYGVGDCLIGSQFVTASGGFRDEADEGAHPMDLQFHEDTKVFVGSCKTGCTNGSTTVGISVTAAPGTQGEGRYLLNTTPAKTISGGTLIGGARTANNLIGPTASFSGTSFPTSVFLMTTQVAPASATAMAPGTVTLPIATTGVPSPFATTTAALPAATGVACVTDAPQPFSPTNYEMAQYTAVDATHLSLTLNKVHGPGATIAVGGLCGYGLEQTVDTVNGIRQVFPVIGAASATSLFYAGNLTPIVGAMGTTSAYLHLEIPIASAMRSGGTVTLTTGQALPVDVNGLTLSVSGIADASYNGQVKVTTTGPNTLSYANAGSDGSSTGGTLKALTGGYVLYPMAEVLGVFNQATKAIDGQMTLAANTVAWAPGDSVEQPHYFQENVLADVSYVGQTVPRPVTPGRAGVLYDSTVGPGLRGWGVTNIAPASSYFGNGGTHGAPDDAFEVQGIWNTTMEAQAGETNVFQLHCNSHGCGRWNSAYNLFALDSSASKDTVAFQPMTSALTMTLRGTSYGFTPQAMTAGTVNAGTVTAKMVTAGTVNATNFSVLSDATAPQLLSFTEPNLATGSQFCQGFGRGITAHNSTFYCWWNTPTPYGSLETYAGGDPLQMKGSSMWLNGGPVAIGNGATIGSALPALLNVGSSAQFQVDAAGNIKAANFAGILPGQTGVIGGVALAAGTCASGTAAVNGATQGTPVIASASDGSLPNGLTMLSAAVTGANTVTVQVCAVSAVTPMALRYNVRVVQ